jgi:hypothetical protein
VERFEGNSGLAVLFGVTGIFIVAIATFAAVGVATQFTTLTRASAAFVVYSVCAMAASGLFLIYAAREASAYFVVDDERITRRTWGYAKAIAWHDIVREREYHPGGSKGKAGMSWRCILYDGQGRRLAIPFRWVADGLRLHALVESRLASVRAAELRDLAQHGGRIRPGLQSGIVLLTCITPLFLLAGLTTFDAAGAALMPPDQGRKNLAILCLVISPFLLLMSAELITRRLEITTSGLALRSLFLDRSIAFASVDSIAVKVVDAEHQVVSRVTVRGNDGQKIAFNSEMPGFRAVLELVRLRAGAKACVSAVDDPDFA